MVYIDRG